MLHACMQVAGALYYFPFQGGSETLPMEDSTSFDPGDSTVDLTQGEKHTQATQAGHQADGAFPLTCSSDGLELAVKLLSGRFDSPRIGLLISLCCCLHVSAYDAMPMDMGWEDV